MNLAEGLKVWIALLEIKLLDLLCLFQYRLSLMFLRLGVSLLQKSVVLLSYFTY